MLPDSFYYALNILIFANASLLFILLVKIHFVPTRKYQELLQWAQTSGNDGHDEMTVPKQISMVGTAKGPVSHQTMAESACTTGIDKSAGGQPAKSVPGNVSDAFSNCNDLIGAATSGILSWFGLPFKRRSPPTTVPSSSQSSKNLQTKADKPFDIDVAAFLSNVHKMQHERKQARSEVDELVQDAADIPQSPGDSDEEHGECEEDNEYEEDPKEINYRSCVELMGRVVMLRLRTTSINWTGLEQSRDDWRLKQSKYSELLCMDAIYGLQDQLRNDMAALTEFLTSDKCKAPHMEGIK